jgi:hypothetical protein
MDDSIVLTPFDLGSLMVRFYFTNSKYKFVEFIASIKEQFADKNN